MTLKYSLCLFYRDVKQESKQNKTNYVYSMHRIRNRALFFNNDKTMKVWGLKNAKIAGKRIILIKPMISG